MTGADSAIRGSFFDFTGDPWKMGRRELDAARFLPDGLLVAKDGLIEDFGPYAEVSARRPGIPVTSFAGRLILPGFIDGHVHFPQTRVLGAPGEDLLDWLTRWIFREEARYGDREYARQAAIRFFDALLAGGSTTCLAFTTASPACAEEFFEEAGRRNMRVIAGLTGMDRFAPGECLITPRDFYRESKRLIERYHGKGRALYAVTPRFALGASEEMLAACRRLKEEHPDVWVNTHIAENTSEIGREKELFPDCPDSTAIFEKHGLLGPRFVAGHGVWLSEGEMRRFSSSGAALAFCPLSNLYLGSGLFPLGRAKDPAHPVRLALGSDVGAGNAFTLVRVMDEARKVGMARNVLAGNDAGESERNRLTACRAYHLATLGGAEALRLEGMLGNFEKGKEADFVVLDWNAGQAAMAWRQSLAAWEEGPRTAEQAAELLHGIMTLGDDRNVDEVWIAGRRAYRR